MPSLTITSRGQVTFRKEILKHLGIPPGGRIRLELLPGGRAELRAEERQGSWDDVIGCLSGKTDGKRFTIEEIEEAIDEGWAEQGKQGL